MGASQQALLMVGEGDAPPPISTCVPDPYYSCGPNGDPYWANVVLMLHGEGEEGSSTVVDSSDIGHTFSVNLGTPINTRLQQKFGLGSLEINDNFEGWIGSTSALSLAAGEDLTIEFWIRPLNLSGPQALFCTNWLGSLGASIAVGTNNAGFRVFLGQGSGPEHPTSLALNTWQHVACCRRGNTATIFLNGVPGTTISSTSNAVTPSQITLGIAASEFGYSNGAGECQLDEFRITKGIARYTGPFNIPAEAYPDFEGDVGYFSWPRTVAILHNDSAPLEDDSCYQEKTLALTGSADVETTVVKFGTGAVEVLNTGSSTINGFTLADHQDFDFDVADFTIECWAYRLANTYTGYLYYATMGGEFSFRVLTTGLITITYIVNGTTTQTRTTAVSFPLNQWNFVVIQRRGLNFEFYLNGTLADTVAVSGGAGSTVDSTGIWYWGRSNASAATNWNGYLDETRVTRGVARYVGDFTPPTLPDCNGTVDPGGTSVNGTAFLAGASTEVQTGSITVQDPWAALASTPLISTAGNLVGGSPDRVLPLSGQSVTASRGTVIFFDANKTAFLSGVAATTGLGEVFRAPYPGLISGSTIGNTNVDSQSGFSVLAFFPDGTLTFSVYRADSTVVGTPITTQWIDKANTNFIISTIAHQYQIVTTNNFGGLSASVSSTDPSIIGTLVPAALPANLGTTKYVYWVTSAVPSGNIVTFPVNTQVTWAPTPNNPDASSPGYYGTFLVKSNITVISP